MLAVVDCLVPFPPVILIWAHSIYRETLLVRAIKQCQGIMYVGRSRSYIELSAINRSSAVQGDHLGAQEVLAVFDAFRDLDLLVPAAVDNRVRAPDTVAEAGLLDLEPIKLGFRQMVFLLAVYYNLAIGRSARTLTSHCPHHCLW
jgi:hypothetical protein